MKSHLMFETNQFSLLTNPAIKLHECHTLLLHKWSTNLEFLILIISRANECSCLLMIINSMSFCKRRDLEYSIEKQDKNHKIDLV
jgi:hypothetical protein